LALGAEEILEPDLPIIDAHHHFYDRPNWLYMEDEYLADLGSGHKVLATVYMQAQTRYYDHGPEMLRVVGETAYVAQQADALSATGTQLAAGIVGHADLRAGAKVREVLEAHIERGRGRFRGIRHLTAWDADASLVNPLSAAPAGLLGDTAYREGVAQLAPLGLSYDAWLFFHQLPELCDLAQRFPDLPIIVNHCGGVLRIGEYANQRDDAYAIWRKHMRRLAQLPNVFVKLGGLGMRINGFHFEQAEAPPTSYVLAETWRPWMEPCIEFFGTDRCMFESNFPVDKGSYPYATVWNAFKRLTASANAGERLRLFSETARRLYRLAELS
jgi:predicted TIM-barrel fold metal-dependent hydrolase